jgi:hypothetical protein
LRKIRPMGLSVKR